MESANWSWSMICVSCFEMNRKLKPLKNNGDKTMGIDAPRRGTEIGDMADIGSMNHQVNPFGQHPVVRSGKGDRRGIEIPFLRPLRTG